MFPSQPLEQVPVRSRDFDESLKCRKNTHSLSLGPSEPSGAIGRLQNEAKSWIWRFCAQPGVAGVTLVRALLLPHRDTSVSPALPWQILLQGILGMWASEGFFQLCSFEVSRRGLPLVPPCPGQPRVLAPSLASAGDATGARGWVADTKGFVSGIPGKIEEKKKKEKGKKKSYLQKG